MLRVAFEPIAVEVLAEKFLAEGDGCVGACALESGLAPGLLAAFDDDRTRLAIKTIGVNLEPAGRRLLEDERERREKVASSQPNAAAVTLVQLRLEVRGVQPAYGAVRPVADGNDVVSTAEIGIVRYFGFEV